MSKGLHGAALLAVLLLPAAGWAHAGHTDPQPWDVCAGQPLGSDCSWTAADHTLRAGSCREIGGALMCVRTKPIVPAATGPSEPVAQAQALWWGGGLIVLLLVGTAVALMSRRLAATGEKVG